MEINDTPKISSLEPIVVALDRMNNRKLALDVVDAFYKRSMNYEEYDEIAKCYFKLKEYELEIGRAHV